LRDFQHKYFISRMSTTRCVLFFVCSRLNNATLTMLDEKRIILPDLTSERTESDWTLSSGPPAKVDNESVTYMIDNEYHSTITYSLVAPLDSGAKPDHAANEASVINEMFLRGIGKYEWVLSDSVALPEIRDVNPKKTAFTLTLQQYRTLYSLGYRLRYLAAIDRYPDYISLSKTDLAPLSESPSDIMTFLDRIRNITEEVVATEQIFNEMGYVHGFLSLDNVFVAEGEEQSGIKFADFNSLQSTSVAHKLHDEWMFVTGLYYKLLIQFFEAGTSMDLLSALQSIQYQSMNKIFGALDKKIEFSEYAEVGFECIEQMHEASLTHILGANRPTKTPSR
jgi:hypothetical protein